MQRWQSMMFDNSQEVLAVSVLQNIWQVLHARKIHPNSQSIDLGNARLREYALQFSCIIESWQPVLPRNWVDKQPSENASDLNESFSKGQIRVSTHSFKLRLQHLRCWRQPNLLVCVRHVPACEHYREDILTCLAKAWTPLLALWLTMAARSLNRFLQSLIWSVAKAVQLSSCIVHLSYLLWIARKKNRVLIELSPLEI